MEDQKKVMYGLNNNNKTKYYMVVMNTGRGKEENIDISVTVKQWSSVGKRSANTNT